jgi:hypothetical protein
MCHLRLGEWLPEPMTPLFADWLLERIDHGERQATRDHVGTTLLFPHAAINGWYYLATPPLSPRTIATALLQTASPQQLAGIVDQVGAAAGEQLWSLAVVGGAAWKMEGASSPSAGPCCALRLGQTLHAHRVIDQAEDVFFLTRAELDTRTPLQDLVDRRRSTWERQRRLLAP